MSVLKAVQLVRFDPKNRDHVKAMFSILNTGRLHPTIRFDVERPFQNAVDMAKHVMATMYAADLLGEPFIDIRDYDLLKTEEVVEVYDPSIPTLSKVYKKGNVRNIFNIPDLHLNTIHKH